jgi:uncharacterized protein (UPF0264 family)
MKNMLPRNGSQMLSATIGDFPNLPGSASLAALGAAVSGADIVKVGLKGPKNVEEGIKLMKSVVKAVKNFNNKIKVVTAGYADYIRMKNSLDYLSIPTIAAESGSDVAMLDTYIKDEKGLFDFLNVSQLIEFKKRANGKINPEIIGVRSMVCEGYDRNNGTIKLDLIENLKSQLV